MPLVNTLLAKLILDLFVSSLPLPKGSTGSFQNPISNSDNGVQSLPSSPTVLLLKPLPSISLTQQELSEYLFCVLINRRPTHHKHSPSKKRELHPIMPFQSTQSQRGEPILEGRYYPFKCFSNEWYDCFLTRHDRSGKDDEPAVDRIRSWGIVKGSCDCLEILLQTSGSSGSPSEADEVKRYCKAGPGLEAVQGGIDEAGTRRAAWVDDRNSPDLTGKGNVRLCGTWLTATGLLRHLRQGVWHFQRP